MISKSDSSPTWTMALSRRRHPSGGALLVLSTTALGAVSVLIAGPQLGPSAVALCLIALALLSFGAAGLRSLRQQRATLQRAREAEECFRVFAANVHEVFWVMDLTRQKPVYASPSWERLTGLPLETVHRNPRRVLEILHPDDRKRVWEHMLGSPRSPAEPHSEIEFRIVRPDGEQRWIQQRSVSLRDRSGRVTRLTGFARDVTEQKRMEASLRESEARSLLSERMACLGTLAAGVGHEINNPLTYLLCNLELSQRTIRECLAGDFRDPRLDKALQLLDIAVEGSCRIRDIVRELRTFSRGDSEQTHAVDISSCIEGALSIAQNQVRHRARLVKQLASLPPVRANEVRLGQVFLNLIVNAAQAMPEGKADEHRLTISSYLDEHNANVVVEVSDTGSGIPAEHLHRIFEPFFTTKARGEGTGLGLFLAEQSVRSYGGSIRVESQLGRGTTFRVSLPIADALTERTRSEDGNAEIATPRAQVLVVDDEREVGVAVAALLEREHEVTTAQNGTEALALLRTKRFDLVLCDLMMPSMSASQFYEELRRTMPEQAARVCFMTGGVFSDATQSFLEQAGRPFIHKPFSLASLRALVAQGLAT